MPKKLYSIRKSFRLSVTSSNNDDYVLTRDLSLHSYTDIGDAQHARSLILRLRSDLTVTVFAIAELVDTRGNVCFAGTASYLDDAMKLLFAIIPPSYNSFIASSHDIRSNAK